MDYTHKNRGTQNLAVVAENLHSLKSFLNVWQAQKHFQITRQNQDIPLIDNV
jgi:hypothetical protein